MEQPRAPARSRVPRARGRRDVSRASAGDLNYDLSSARLPLAMVPGPRLARLGDGDLVDPPDVQEVHGEPSEKIDIYTDGGVSYFQADKISPLAVSAFGFRRKTFGFRRTTSGFRRETFRFRKTRLDSEGKHIWIPKENV